MLYMKYKQSRYGFEPASPCPFPTTVSITPRTSHLQIFFACLPLFIAKATIGLYVIKLHFILTFFLKVRLNIFGLRNFHRSSSLDIFSYKIFPSKTFKHLKLRECFRKEMKKRRKLKYIINQKHDT